MRVKVRFRTVLVVAGSISVPRRGPGSGSIVRVVVVVIGVIVRRLVRVVWVVSGHHVLPPDRGRRLLRTLVLARRGAQLRSAAGGGDPRGEPGRTGGRVVNAAEDDHRAAAAG